MHHVTAAMSLLQARSVCDAKYDFESLWDYQRGALEVRQQRNAEPALGALGMDGSNGIGQHRRGDQAESCKLAMVDLVSLVTLPPHFQPHLWP